MQNGHSSPSSHRKTGEGRRLTGGGQSGRSGLRGWPWTGGKGRGGYGEPIPGLTSSYGGAQRRGDGSRRRRAGVAAAAALRAERGG